MAKAEPWGAEAEDLYAERVKANVRWLAEVNQIALEAAAGMARIAPSALWHILRGTNLPSFKTLVRLAAVLGVEPGDLFLEADALRQKVEDEGLRPFTLRRPGIISPPSSEGSEAAARNRTRPRQGLWAAQQAA